MHQTFGTGVAINPHIAAFALVARVVDDWLKAQPGSPLGILISDDNREVVRDVEKLIRVLRGIEGSLKLRQVVEKGFFIDSSTSLMVQLCDLIAFNLRKMEETAAGLRVPSLHQDAIELIQPLIHRGDEALQDVVAWLSEEKKKERPGTMS